MTDIEYRCLTGEAAAEVLNEEYVGLYQENYSEPPYLSGPLYSTDRYAERTGRQVKSPGFVLVSARSGPTLVGFSFGLTFEADRWWGGETTPPPAEIANSRKFAVIELNVRRGYRRVGIGRRLLETLLAQQDAPYATLLSDPQAPAYDMYRRWGWKVIGPVRPAPDARPYDALVLELGCR
ncbi:GNAT family N-acetyltransferase [Streptosporangium sp. NPDC023615]|uniref:GNAT family N-acetyltransferase n=1 Tax=Streptosporangium sp. NPDC023615 TaxID=3154794 RepID=UPI00341287A7